MRDPQRLATSGDEFERRVLSAGIGERAPARSARKIAAAIGVGAALGGTAASARVGGRLAATTKALFASTALKWAGLATLAVAAAGATALVGARDGAPRGARTAVPTAHEVARDLRAPPPAGELHDAPPAEPIPSRPPSAAPSREPVAAARGAGVVRGAAHTEKANAPAQADVSLAASSAATGPPPAGPTFDSARAMAASSLAAPESGRLDPKPTMSASSLAAETAALDEARAALRANDPARALAELDAYDRRFPGGVLAPEARVLRIEVTDRAGDRSAAERMAKAFVRDDPDSPLVPRVLRIVHPQSNP